MRTLLMPLPKGRAARAEWIRGALAWCLDEYVYADVAALDAFAPPFGVMLHAALVPVARSWSGLRELLSAGPLPAGALEAARGQIHDALTALVRDRRAASLPVIEVRPRALLVAEPGQPAGDFISAAARAGSPFPHDEAVLMDPTEGPAPPLRLVFQTALAPALVVGVLTLAGLVPRGAIRRCLSPEGDGFCPRLYLGVKHQRYCPRHQRAEPQRLRQRAAERAFRARQRTAKAKKKPTTKKKRSAR